MTTSTDPSAPEFLAVRYFLQRTPEAKLAAIESVRPRVEAHARRRAAGATGYVDESDLLAVGLVGAEKALNRFTPGTGAFVPLCIAFANGEMLHFIRDCSTPIRIPGQVREMVRMMARAEAALRARGMPVTVEAVSREMGAPIELVEDLRDARSRMHTGDSLDNWRASMAASAGIYGRDGDEPETTAMATFLEALSIVESGGSVDDLATHFNLGEHEAHSLHVALAAYAKDPSCLDDPDFASDAALEVAFN